MLKKPTFKLIGLYRFYFQYPISFPKGIFMNISDIQRVDNTYRNEFNSLFAEPNTVLLEIIFQNLERNIWFLSISKYIL